MTTRAALQSAVDRWMLRSDIGSSPDFATILRLAESYIATDVRLVVQEQEVTLSITDRSADLPANYVGLRNLYLPNSPEDKIEYQTPEVLRQSAAWKNGRAGAFYTLEGGSDTPGDERVQITIAGPASPSSPLELSVLYWARLDPLVESTDTNWLLTNHFPVYLYGCLRAGFESMHDYASSDRFGALYTDAVSRVNGNEMRKRQGSVPKQAYGSPRTIV